MFFLTLKCVQNNADIFFGKCQRIRLQYLNNVKVCDQCMGKKKGNC